MVHLYHMARWTSSRRVHFTFEGMDFTGAAGEEFDIPDGWVPAFEAWARDNIRGFRWVRRSDTDWLDDRLEALEAGGGGSGDHPGLATHTGLGLASSSSVTTVSDSLTAHAAALDPHPNYALDADLTDHEAEGHVHDHDEAYAALGHNHDGTYAALGHDHDADYAALGHNHDADYEAAGAVATHAAAGDPHPGYTTSAELTAAIAAHTSGETHGGGGGGGEAFPVGAVFIGVVSTDPATLLGYGTWEAFGAGRVLVGRDSGDTDFDTAEETGGAKTHTHAAHSGVLAHSHTVTDPGHTHVEQQNSATNGGLAGWGARDTSTNTAIATDYSTASAQTGVTVDSAGSGSEYTHDSPEHLMPYIVVYMWKRTA